MSIKTELTQKLLITLTFSTLFSLSCFAQDNTSWKKLHWGFKLNPTFGYLHVSGDPTVKSDGLKLGFSFGITADWILQKNIAFSSQFNVTTINGGTNTVTMVPTNTPTAGTVLVERDNRTLYALRYIELPLAFKFKTNTIGDGSSFYIKTGIDPALRISSKGSGSISSGGAVSIQKNKDLQGQLKSTRLGWLVGTGYDYRFNRDLTFTSGLVFNQGLNNISTTSESIKNSYLAIEFGIYF